jgi:uncharacterized protein YkwD
MSWASHPTNEMPATSANAGRHRRRRSGVIRISVAAALLVLTVVATMLSPTLLGWVAPTSNTAGAGPAGSADPSGSEEPASPSLILSSKAASPTASPVTAAATPKALEVTPSTRSATDLVATGIEALENGVVGLTNVERTAKGCAALRADSKLHTAARAYGAEMASLQQLTHTGANGSSPGDRMKLAGYDTSAGWAENVAAGYPTPQAVITGWMNSEGHRNNILNCSLKAIGVGVARAGNGQLYWTQDFGGR